jgi:hypothetical protein
MQMVFRPFRIIETITGISSIPNGNAFANEFIRADFKALRQMRALHGRPRHHQPLFQIIFSPGNQLVAEYLLQRKHGSFYCQPIFVRKRS